MYILTLSINYHGSAIQESACNAGAAGSVPGSGRSPERGNGNPLQDPCLRLPWTELAGRLQSMGLQRVGPDWALEHSALQLSQHFSSLWLWWVPLSCILSRMEPHFLIHGLLSWIPCVFPNNWIYFIPCTMLLHFKILVTLDMGSQVHTLLKIPNTIFTSHSQLQNTEHRRLL